MKFLLLIVKLTLTCCAGAVQKTMQDFVRESELMADLRHPNIVCLIGVCMQEEPKVGLHAGGTKGGSASRRNQRWVCLQEEPKVGQHAGRTKGGGHQVAIRNVTASNPDIQPNYSYKV